MRVGQNRRRPSTGAAVAAVLAVALLMLAGCRAAEEWSYDRPHVTPFELDRDLTRCARQARPTGPLAYPSLTGPDREAFNRCMEKRGYTVTRRPAGD